MYTLALDTSNQLLGVAIMEDNQLIGEIVTNISKNHSVRLMPAVEQLMKDVQISPDQLGKIIVAKGPGSYTGVRIGMTTAKTLAWALKIPVIGVSSLKALCYQGVFFHGLICPFFDARRGRVYTGLYYSNEGTLQLVKNERNTDMQPWLEEIAKLDEPVLFLSPDIEKYKETINDMVSLKARIPSYTSVHMTNPSHLLLASEQEETDSIYHMTPNYLRLAEAEANWLRDNGKKADA